MSLLTPLALLSALIVGPLIVAMYLLKLRREERRVSSTFLWRRMVRDVEANAPWQRLRRNWLLFLQLLLLLLLAMALARPFFLTTGISGRNLIIIIDRSASMAATDVPPSRLEAARRQAQTLVDQLPEGGRATIIAVGGQMEVVAASTTDRRQMYDAIRSIRLSVGGRGDLSQALALATALAAREPDSEVAIISDGNVEIPTDIRVPATVRYFPIGQRAENVAISAMALQPGPAGQTLFVQATNYGPASVVRRLDLYLDGALFNAYELNLGPDGAADAVRTVIVDVPAQVRVAEARLSPAPGVDFLPSDDRAWAVSSADAGVEVRIVGPGNRFLETALALLPGITATKATTTTVSGEAAPQITIFDRVAPETLPAGNLVFIAPMRSTNLFSVTGVVDFPLLRPAPIVLEGQAPPLLRNISVSEVNVLRAMRIEAGMWARTLVEGDGSPMLLAGEREGRRIVILAFALQDSDLPLQVAFPLLISNIIGYLAPGSGLEASQIVPGQPLAVAVDPAVTAVRVIRPDGRVEAAQIQGGQAIYAGTDALGPYLIEQARDNQVIDQRRFAVNLFTPEESRIAPASELRVPQVSGLQQAVTREQVGRQEIWRWLAAAAILVIIIEWLVYQRSGLAYLWQRIRLTLAARRRAA
ncbi:MAG: BatA and WFA domain-containing protein [Roseiflexus sp.]|nr:BatA and WFA domain-containing protein [Roseiflexus sp.]MCS7289117.1 BatA and WFA domain-containing protein [Roseiflexus sp.]MDW8233265.1 BatA and WFA domain-containing protein [Roseiflexaceae bacterium]